MENPDIVFPQDLAKTHSGSKDIGMKRIGLTIGIAVALCTSSVNTQAHGCGGGLFWPFLAFGLTVAAVEASRPHYPAYTYYEPSYTYAPPPVYNNSPQPQPLPAPPPEPAPWTPSTPGAGQWIPDSQPYQYAPSDPAKRQRKTGPANLGQTVTVSKTAGGIPLYINSR